MKFSRKARRITRPGVAFQPNLIEGTDLIAKLARGTLGPLARSVMVEATTRSSTPEVLDDAGTLARRVVQIGDPVADTGAMLMRHALWRMRELHGDGAATTAVIAQTLIREAARACAAGAHPSLLREALTTVLAAALEALSAAARPVSGGAQGNATLAAVARAMSADTELRDAIVQAVDIVGADGAIKIVPNQPCSIMMEFIEGAMWDIGLQAPGFSKTLGKSLTRLEDAAVVVMRGALNSAEAAISGLKRLADARITRVLIVSDKLGDDAQKVMLQIHHRGVMELMPVRAPFTGAEALQAVQDIAVLTGATELAVGEDVADAAFARLDPGFAGSARRVWADEGRFGIVAGARQPEVLRAHIAVLRRRIAQEVDSTNLDKLRARLGRLYGGMALIRVGAPTVKAGEARRDEAARMAKALQAALTQGVLAGGGAALVHIADAVEALPVHVPHDALTWRWASSMLAAALRAPLYAIAANAGHDPTHARAQLVNAAQHEVFDVRSGVRADMHAAGVIDALEMLRSALRIAVSTAVMTFTTDAVILRKNPPTGAQP
jgi:chaperonin GroEL